MEAADRPGPSTKQAVPGQEEMPELPDEEPREPENGSVKEEEGDAKAKAEERSRYGQLYNCTWLLWILSTIADISPLFCLCQLCHFDREVV